MAEVKKTSDADVLPFGAEVGTKPGVVKVAHERSDNKPDVVITVTTN